MYGVAAVAGSMIRLRSPRSGGLKQFPRDIQDTCDCGDEYFNSLRPIHALRQQLRQVGV